jgi:acetyl-CoA carboxylase biotin carboxyl carrier protein
MDHKTIQDIIRLVNKSDLTEVEIVDKDFKLHIKRAPDAPVSSVGFQPVSDVHFTAPTNTPSFVEHKPAATSARDEVAETAANLHTIVSPMIGTYYGQPSPDKDPYIKVGDVIRKGQVLCIIEAMKLFNEIESEVEGKVVKILVENARPVEYEQPLILIEPI